MTQSQVQAILSASFMDEKTPQKRNFSALEAVEIVWEIGISIALPTVAFALGGRWLDKRLGTSPWFLIIGLFLSLTIVGFIVIKKGREIAKKL